MLNYTLILTVAASLLAFGLWSMACFILGYRCGQKGAAGETLGNPVQEMLDVAKDAESYFDQKTDEDKETSESVTEVRGL